MPKDSFNARGCDWVDRGNKSNYAGPDGAPLPFNLTKPYKATHEARSLVSWIVNVSCDGPGPLQHVVLYTERADKATHIIINRIWETSTAAYESWTAEVETSMPTLVDVVIYKRDWPSSSNDLKWRQNVSHLNGY